jgi:hypothetical protein
LFWQEKEKGCIFVKKRNIKTMTRETLIQRIITVLEKLPQDKASEIADFADYILKKYNDSILQKGIETLISDSKTFSYLKNEEDLYTLADLKERYK